MTEDAPSGGSRRDIATNSLRALRAARGDDSAPPASDETPVDETPVDETPVDETPVEVFDDPSELTDDPAIQPRAAESTDATVEPEVEPKPAAAETEAAAADTEVLDDPSELTDDPAVQPEAPEAATEPEVEPEAAAAAETEVEAPIDDESGAEAQADAEADALAETSATENAAETVAEADALAETTPAATENATPSDAIETATTATALPETVALSKAGAPTDAPTEAGPAADDDSTTADDEPPALATSGPRSGRTGRSHRTATPRSPGTARRRPRPLVAVASVVALLALVFGVVSGVVWYRAGHADARTVALARDKVAVDARLAITTVSTSDYRQPDAALSNWLEVTTGSLKASYSDSKAATIKLLAQAKTITTATVLDAAVTALNTTKGTATVIAGVNLTKKPATGSAIVTRNRLRASMKQVGGEWKLADLALVSVGLT